MAVVRCVCYRRHFAELKRLADSRGWTRVAEISRETGCGTGCGSCVPYLQAMLRTGATCFRVKAPGLDPVPCDPDPWDPPDPSRPD